MSGLPNSKDAVTTRTDALIYWCAVVLFVWVLTVAVMSIAGFAGYIYTRWLT